MSVAGRGPDAKGPRTPFVPVFRRIVAIGGGTGLPAVLQGLKSLLFPPGRPPRSSLDRARLTAIVTVSDDGGSTGRLRRAYNIPAPGDLRNCLVALSSAEPLLADLFNYRFDDALLRGHSFGNLFLAVLTRLTGDFRQAIERARLILGVRGRVIPSTTERVVRRPVPSSAQSVTR